jgi:hypothetical protein
VAGIILGDASMAALFELQRDEQAAYSKSGLFEYYEARVGAVQKAFFALRDAARADLQLRIAKLFEAGTFAGTSATDTIRSASEVRDSSDAGG